MLHRCSGRQCDAFNLTASAPKAHGSGRCRATLPLRGECISPSAQVGNGLTNTPTDDCALLLLSPLQYYSRAFVSFDGACRYPHVATRFSASSYRRRRCSYRPALNDTVHIILAHVYVCKACIQLACPARARHLEDSPSHNLRARSSDAPGHRKKKGKVKHHMEGCTKDKISRYANSNTKHKAQKWTQGIAEEYSMLISKETVATTRRKVQGRNMINTGA
jgi:hypothetical protein